MNPLALRVAATGLAGAAVLAIGLWISQGRAEDRSAMAASRQVHDVAPHAHPTALAAEATLSGDSVFHLRDAWTDQHGRTLRFTDLAGHPTVVVMFYGNCMTACPVLLRDAERVEAALSDAERARTRFLMVTFDPDHDTPERMAAYAAAKGLDRDRWSFLTADARAVQRLAAALGVRYRADGQGGFAHTNLVTLLDPNGVVAMRREGLGLDAGPMAAAIAEM